ncbi:hypothetical protein D9Q98_008315 [Chlorella vulgaris]|uniref:CBS domain-containing protein n=1 Tax=Chlorella vulgaris TaxID=3077 RepID=A0A9D4TGB3_CHLVU|nr:hypothetical protein D9Q98_008315 [Chlorella vulgaris]
MGRPSCLARSSARTRNAGPSRRAPTVVRRSNRVMEGDSVEVTGEWEAVESMGSKDDVLAWYNKVHESKHARLHDVMQTNLVLTNPEASLADVTALLDGPPSIEGMPVVDSNNKLVGVISRKDLGKGGSTVKDVMSAEPVSLKASATVSDAATIMIERKFHRVPVVGDDNQCVGIVTRTDIFWALTQSDQEGETPLTQHGLDV